jgi:hypothetical protein
MRTAKAWPLGCAFLAMAAVGVWTIAKEPAIERTGNSTTKRNAEPSSATSSIKPAEIAPFVKKGIAWLIAAQNPDGGWGAGSHAHQEVRDPHAVSSDPATTAFTLLSLLRSGHTPVAGEYKAHVRHALEYLVATVEKAPSDGPRITSLDGTQPQTKLGRNVDTPLTAQYLARAVKLLAKDDQLYKRTDAALDKCLAKLQASQEKNGGWGQGSGWAPVLQSSLSCSALEIAQASGKAVDGKKLAAARGFQKGQVTMSGPGGARASGGAAAGSAGVELYAFNGAFRGNASEARQAQSAINDAVKKGDLPATAKPTAQNLERAGAGKEQAKVLEKAYSQNEGQIQRLGDEKLLAGFGSNGGEEYLSYLLTSETLVIAGADKFNQWNDKMHGRLQKIQNNDGSWAGLHCITSPVFCTAAVVQCLTTDRDATFLIAMAEKTKPGDKKKTEVARR